MPPISLYIVEGKRVNGLVRTEPEGMAYDAFRALGMRVPRRVPEAGEGEGVNKVSYGKLISISFLIIKFVFCFAINM